MRKILRSILLISVFVAMTFTAIGLISVTGEETTGTRQGKYIILYQPTGGSVWYTGTSYDIKFETEGVSSVDIFLFKGGTELDPIKEDFECDDGMNSYKWKVPTNLELGTDYKVQIYHDRDLSVKSNAFEITTEKSIEVTSPDSKSVWAMGETFTIKWNYEGPVGTKVSIALHNDDGQVKIVEAKTTMDGEFDWTIAKDLSPRTDYKIKISDKDDWDNFDFSEKFTITEEDGGGGDDDVVDDDDAEDTPPTTPYAYNVDAKKYFDTISEAIASTYTTDGHTLEVSEGTFKEHVNIDKKVNLVGAGSDVTIIDAEGTGVGLKLSKADVTVSGFTVKNGETGIEFLGGGNTAENCVASSNTKTGIKIAGSSNNKIKNCVCNENDWGISVSAWGGVTNNIITDTTCSSNSNMGIDIWDGASSTTVKNCLISSNDVGIAVEMSGTSTITHNIFKKNTGYGLKLSYDSNSNVVHHNNFIDNNNGGVQALDEEGNSNTWNDDTEGNYWSTWTTPDSDDDGIVDDAYAIDGGAGSMDNYPLADPNNHLPVFQTTPPLTGSVGSKYTYTPSATDIDGDKVTFTLASGPEGMTVSSGVLTWTPSESQVGENHVKLQGSDASRDVLQEFTIHISKSSTSDDDVVVDDDASDDDSEDSPGFIAGVFFLSVLCMILILKEKRRK